MLASLILCAANLVATPADLAFLQGDWEGRSGTMTFQERWTDASGGLMLGLSRNLKGEGAAQKAVGFEFLRIEFRADGKVFYVAQPGGQPKSEFELTALQAGSAVFENPAHPHLRRIQYRLLPEGGLQADLEFVAGEKQSFSFRRVGR